MPVYICKDGPLSVTFGYDRFVFAKNQLVDTVFPQIVNHPSFDLVTDPMLIKRAPPVNKIFPLPVPSEFLSNEQLVAELRKYGVEPNPYELTDKLAYQLNMLRSLNKRSNITVLDDDGEPMWYEEYVELEKKLTKEAREKNPINPPKVKVSLASIKKEPEEYKLANKKEYAKEKKKGGSVGAVEYNDDYELGREHEVDDLIQQQLNHRYEAKVDKVISEKGDLFREEEVTVDTSELSIEDFEYLVDLKPFCLEDFTEEERENLTYKNLRLISLATMYLFLKNKGLAFDFGKGSDRGFKFREQINKLIKESPRGQEYIVELNALQKRYKEIEATTPDDVRKCSQRALRARISKLRHYGIDTDYSKNMDLSELRRLYKRYTLLTQFGMDEEKHEDLYQKFKEFGLEDLIEDYIHINTNDSLKELDE
jgi:hypothetical protein